MSQQTVIITGANSGIGKAATAKFAAEGHTVIMACRNHERSRTVRDQIATETGNDRLFVEQVDMSSQDSPVRQVRRWRFRKH